jgi:sterol 14-demethylase
VQAKHRIESMIYDLIQERRRHPLEPKDLFQEFIESTYYGGKPLPERLVVSILLFIPWAGHETTVGHTGWTIIELLRHEDYLARVQAELSEVLGEAQLYSSENLKKLRTLDWAIKETERMHPAAHMYMRGVRDDFDIDGYEVAEGSMVFVVPEVAHRLPEVFEDPDRYDPLRFAPDRAEDATP